MVGHMSSISDNEMKRLVFIKYFYYSAVDNSNKSEPMSFISMLMFHDNIELFLNLIAEHVNADVSEKTPFMVYWDKIKDKGIDLGQKVQMNRLNKVRVDLKHHFITPNESNIEEFRSNVKTFLEENTLKIFGIDFISISLADLIQYEETKENIKKAEECLNKDNILEALDFVALAYDKLINKYNKTIEKKYGASPFSFKERFTRVPALRVQGVGEINRDERIAIESLQKAVNSIQLALQSISIGIDYRNYFKFWLLTPSIYYKADGKHHIIRRFYSETGIPTRNDAQFCINFVVESALTIQKIIWI